MISFLLLQSYSKTFSQVEKFKVFQDKSFNPVSAESSVSWSEVDILMVLNLDKKKLHVYANAETDIDIIEFLPTTTDNDGNTWIKYKGIDQDGLRCSIEWEVFKDQSGMHKFTVFLEYSNIYFIYRLKED